MVREKKWAKEIIATVVMLVVVWGGYQLISSYWWRDTWAGIFYEPASAVAEIQESLNLTDKGRRVFNGSTPVIEGRDEFNEHCDSHDAETSLLGCYTDGRIYVYEITNEELKDANKVTMAHELLHAAWARLGNGERERVVAWLDEVKTENAEWFAEELGPYEESERTEEVYTRAATKLRELPEGLEEHYAKYFADRQAVVTYYENYQTPFQKLKQRGAELAEETQKMIGGIEQKKAEYLDELETLNQDIEDFNNCAAKAGCFASDIAFQSARSGLMNRQASLTQKRDGLNSEIDTYNAKLLEYDEVRTSLGELSNAMNSNAVEKIQE